MIGVIADDLTGAAELGAIGWRHGFRAEILRSGLPASHSAIACVDTDSRACDPTEAAKRVAAAARLLHNAGAKWIYKKVDSVLRGNVTAEVEAAMKQLKLDRTLLLPANPQLGRTIRDGEYFIGDRPLHKTEFAHDPHFPRRSSQVLRLIKVPEHFMMRAARGERDLPPGAIVIGDAASTTDLQDWAACCDAKMLTAGGAEFFNALLGARKNGVAAEAPALPVPRDDREFFVVGTSTQASRHFVSEARKHKQAIFALPQELAWGAAFSAPAVEAVSQRIVTALQTHSRVILNVGLPQVRHADVAGRLSSHVVRVAEQVLRQRPVGRVFAEGGATAAELVRRMGWSRLEVRREHAPGVATLAVEGDDHFLLTIKPGTYTWPAQWT